MKLKKCIAIILCSLTVSTWGLSQDNAAFVRDMFEDPEQVTSVRHLAGTINGVHALEVWLASVGGSYRGLMSMNNGSLTFELVGNAEGGNIVLQEIDDRGQVTGYVRGTLGLDRFDGKWWSADVTRSAEIRLREKGLILLEKFEPALVSYSGNFGDEDFRMWLWYEAPDLVSGIVFTDKLCTRVFGACKDEFCREVTVEITNGAFDSAVMTTGRGVKEWQLVMRDLNGARSGVMIEDQRYEIFRGGKVNYTFLADYSYPIIPDGGFDEWIQEHMADWYRTYERDDSLAMDSDSPARWSDFASAWVDIFLMEDGLVSGLITQTEPGSNTYYREAFVYDLNAGGVVAVDEFVRRDTDLLQTLRAKLEAGDPVTYQHPVLTENGFAFCTDFDAVRGDSIQVVPYLALTPVLRKKSVFTKLAD